jgi:ubiquitin carboxyl-terminal hydrolase 7
MIEPLKGKQTLKAAELQDGDIVCFQRVSDKKAENGRASDKSSQESYVLFSTR